MGKNENGARLGEPVEGSDSAKLGGEAGQLLIRDWQ